MDTMRTNKTGICARCAASGDNTDKPVTIVVTCSTERNIKKGSKEQLCHAHKVELCSREFDGICSGCKCSSTLTYYNGAWRCPSCKDGLQHQKRATGHKVLEDQAKHDDEILSERLNEHEGVDVDSDVDSVQSLPGDDGQASSVDPECVKFAPDGSHLQFLSDMFEVIGDTMDQVEVLKHLHDKDAVKCRAVMECIKAHYPDLIKAMFVELCGEWFADDM
jgi:hypothetical protein